LLRVTGASLDDVITLIRRENPDLVLMQEASDPIDDLPNRLGGDYARAPLPGRIHGPAYWSPTKLPKPARVLQLPSGSMVHRVCQVLDVGPFAVANVHLSHGQLLNRRQLRCIAEVLPPHAAVLGDYNLVGPALLPGFRDVGPRHSTQIMVDILPIRIDRCLVRGLTCVQANVLPRGVSDHRPIVVHLAVAAERRSLAA
jgi:endonuclease/exonuclease/phosphatase (EEP) superfamily protein YafD